MKKNTKTRYSQAHGKDMQPHAHQSILKDKNIGGFLKNCFPAQSWMEDSIQPERTPARQISQKKAHAKDWHLLSTILNEILYNKSEGWL